MKFYFKILDSVDSTSEECQRFFQNNNEDDLFVAIAAKEQARGRGRHGHHWESPPGNIYLSCAWKVKEVTSEKNSISSLPLTMGAILQEWIKINFDIETILKWPNDILFAGKKLAGILCQSSFQNGSAIVTVGIGINVQGKFKVDGVFDTEPVSVAEITHQSDWDIGVLVESLAKRIYGVGSNPLSCPTNEVRARASSLEGDLFFHPQTKEIKKYFGVDQDGAMILQNLANEKKEIYQSIEQGHRWVWQKPLQKNFSAIFSDLGNSKTKIVKYNVNGFSEIKNVEEIINTDGSFIPLYWMSVTHSEVENNFLAQLQKNKKIIPCKLNKRFFMLHHSDYQIEQMGIDRIAQIEGAIALAKNNFENILVIGCGTATTLDIIQNKNHRGGFILPSFEIANQSLHQHTAQLPLIREMERQNYLKLGLNTEEAMVNGYYYAMNSFIEKLIVKHHIQKIYVTGGGGKMFSEFFPESQFEKNLGFYGMLSMVQGGIL